jgi:hypothetical protein
LIATASSIDFAEETKVLFSLTMSINKETELLEHVALIAPHVVWYVESTVE